MTATPRVAAADRLVPPYAAQHSGCMPEPDEATDADLPRLQLRVYFDDRRWFGPGKAELLDRIRETGSISAAGRCMGMSYKRAWTLVETLNAMFREPLVSSARGGAQGGGATLTPLGEALLGRYRRIEAATREAAADDLRSMAQAADIADRK